MVTVTTAMSCLLGGMVGLPVMEATAGFLSFPCSPEVWSGNGGFMFPTRLEA